nr:TcdA/TcdB catalytic glycosyltransferase domain-containing protein [Vibrio ouci]
MIKRQNAFYLAFDASNYDSLDEWLINYASRYDKAEAEGLSLELAKSRETYAHYLEQGICRDIHSIDGLMNFKGKDLTKYYFYELILRNNLASASDILRLMILYKIGGTYLDFDTLPCIEHCFRNTNEHHKKQVDFNLVDIVKAEMVLSRVRSLHVLDFNQRDDRLSNILSGCVGIDSTLTNSLFRDVDELDDRAIFKPLEDQYVFKHGLKLSKSKRGLGEYNNNALVAHAGSKTVSIIIRQMLKRYAYIEKMGAIFSGDIVSKGDDEYWSRLIDYRNDALCSMRNVTLFLTGPSLILETILSLSYELLDIDDVSSFTVSTLMQIPALGMSFTEQTQFTSEHMRSTWQSNDNLFTAM